MNSGQRAMNRQEFFARVRQAIGKKHLKLVIRAYWLAKDAHRGQEPRDNGDRYFEHCRANPVILMEFGPTDAEEIILGLLHDSKEDRYIPQDVLRLLFGDYIAKGIDGLSKVTVREDPDTGFITKVKVPTPLYYQKIGASDRRIRRVKCADRLHNLRTMGLWSLPRQARYIKETRQYVLPMAQTTDIRLFKDLSTECEAFHHRHNT